MAKNKKQVDPVLERLRSLEEYLGVKFVPKDGDNYPEHVTDMWGKMKRLDDLEKQVDKLQPVNK